ncbi:hypothetical protein N9917_00310 [Deltaproteobacteria bacterium]|nr:hypothetical protein [Deltaproteobacteria bacterium]
MDRFQRSFNRAQYAYENRCPYGDDDRDEGCNGEGPYEDCEGCEDCTEEVSRTKYVLARKARGRILPGDLVRVTTGFSFQRNGGPRLGYFKRESIHGYGPGHGPEQMGKGNWLHRGSFRAVHPDHADFAEAREAAATAKAEAERQAKAERQAAADALSKAERTAVFTAKEGEQVAYQGRTYTVGSWYTKTVYHSGAEYYGELCDASCYSQRRLTDTETGKTREFRA